MRSLSEGALRIFLQNLPNGSKFNVVAFSEEYEMLFPESVDYSHQNMVNALS